MEPSEALIMGGERRHQVNTARENRVGSKTLQIAAPPSAVASQCVHRGEDPLLLFPRPVHHVEDAQAQLLRRVRKLNPPNQFPFLDPVPPELKPLFAFPPVDGRPMDAIARLDVFTGEEGFHDGAEYSTPRKHLPNEQAGATGKWPQKTRRASVP
jgi:hypothetical protein